MTTVFAFVMILAAAAAIALPFFRAEFSAGEDVADPDERLEREKHVALLAIREADFDHAMGKLSEEDHQSLRGIYEQRAMEAISALDDGQAGGASTAAADGTSGGSPTAAPGAKFCGVCGREFAPEDVFCAGCGAPRPS